ncbi:MAG: hypothetical protein F2942_09860 [Actinobacteria bacterium]|uniref:Unannotated protein n=1 Tax=freshwater metagenome TaxID=449393 RepID=A0A6J7UWR0_9ZZZZ|nr:hypothetical protein [Actinomycetota bacterium]
MNTPRECHSALLSIGVAAPSLRLPAAQVAAGWGRTGGRGQVAVCSPSEDALTLAWLAASRALDSASIPPEEIGGIWWGCTRAPFAEGPSLSFLGAALRLQTNSEAALLSGSPHAGIDALLAADDAVTSGRVRTALVIASDSILPALGSGLEAASGAGAVAVLLSAEGPALLGQVTTQWSPVLDRYRGDLETETREVYDGRLFREQVFLPLCQTVGSALTADPSSRWSLPDPDGRLGRTLGERLGSVKVVSTAARSELGDTGAAAPLLGLAAAMGDPGTLIAVGFGGGRATAISIQINAPVPGSSLVEQHLSGGQEVSYTEALRCRGQLSASGETVEMAVPPGSAMFVRGSHEMLALLGARCLACATVNTPPNVHPTCIRCGAIEFELVPLPLHGTVQTFVVNQTMPAPFVAPLPLIVLDLEDGSRISVQGASDGSDLHIGVAVDLQLRRYALERGVPIYGYAALVSTASENTIERPSA